MKNKKSIKNGWGILFKYLLEYKKQVIFLSVLGVISAIANGTVPYIIGKFFDAILEPATVFVGTQIEMPLWVLLIGIFATMQIVADVVDWINGREQGILGNKMYADYIAQAFSRHIRLPISFHKTKKKGDVNETINRAATTIYNLIKNIVISLTPQFLSVFVGFAIVFYINLPLGVVLLAGILAYVLTLIKVVNPIAVLTKKGNKLWRKAFGDMFDAISNIETVKRFTTEEYESKKIYNEFVNIAAKAWSKVEIVNINVAFYQKIIVTITRVVIFVFSVSLIRNGAITIGELIALNGYAGMVFGPFVTLGMNWQNVQSEIILLEDAEKILNTPQEIYKPQNAVIVDEILGDVEFRGTSFYYKKKDGEVLKDINFKINAGETVALVGESGVGKSTLIDLISGYYFAQKGNVLIDGIDVKKINLKFLRRGIAVVPQEVMLFNDTIKTNIKYGNFKATDNDIKIASKKAHTDIFIKKFPKKYEQVVGERGIKLSVGQKQRVAIARAILRNPKILILDEPTSALDSKTERFITESLEELMKGRTTFIVAHRLSTVRKADRILVFKEGKLVEEGNHDKLMKIKDGVYKNMYEMHIGLA